MGMRSIMKWVANEGTGAGIQKRFLQLILGSYGKLPTRELGILKQFMASAKAAVSKFGPAWARQEVRGSPVGVWLLAMCWIAVPALLLLKAVL